MIDMLMDYIQIDGMYPCDTLNNYMSYIEKIQIDGNCYSRLKEKKRKKNGENDRIMSSQRQTETAVLLVTG